ncbi:MAG: histidinol dehydrogenase, partial [Candidatus Omnitrophica bacterium]|nr:histidinol dehydrogenase [Candidatus Omnitrophota bacterium]
MKRITFEQLKDLLKDNRDNEIEAKVRDIIDKVRDKGDEALIKFTEKFDGVKNVKIKVSEKEIKIAEKGMDKKLIKAIETTK